MLKVSPMENKKIKKSNRVTATNANIRKLHYMKTSLAGIGPLINVGCE